MIALDKNGEETIKFDAVKPGAIAVVNSMFILPGGSLQF